MLDEPTARELELEAEVERLREIENAARTVEYAERVGIPAEIAIQALRDALKETK